MPLDKKPSLVEFIEYINDQIKHGSSVLDKFDEETVDKMLLLTLPKNLLVDMIYNHTMRVNNTSDKKQSEYLKLKKEVDVLKEELRLLELKRKNYDVFPATKVQVFGHSLDEIYELIFENEMRKKED